MLKPTEISKAAPHSSARSSKAVKINAVVTKGKIRVAPKSGLQVVASSDLQANRGTSKVEKAATKEIDQPPSSASAAPWQGMEADDLGSSLVGQGEANDTSLKLVKLVAAASALGVAAIVLLVLQFSGSTAEPTDGSAVATAAAQAATVPAPEVSAVAQAGVQQEQTSAMVAQIAAGTLAALRAGQSNGPGTSASSASNVAVPAVAEDQANGLYAMVLTALEQGQSKSYIDQLVNEAHRAGEVTVPALLITASGEVDTAALLTLFGK